MVFMKARDFRALARQALSGRWGVAVLTGFLAALLGGTMASSGGSGSGGSSVGSSAGEFIQSSGRHYEIPDFVWTALIIFGTLLSIYALVCFIIGGTVQLGYAKFNLALIDHKDAQVSDLFSQFHRFGDGFLLNLLTSIFIFLWSLLMRSGIYGTGTIVLCCSYLCFPCLFPCRWVSRKATICPNGQDCSIFPPCSFCCWY